MERKIKSIMADDLSKCYLCGSRERIEIHHVFPSGLRKRSTEYGLVVPLCRECHQGKDGVHSNRKKMDYLKGKAQERFEEVYPELDFLKIFHRNWKE